MKSITCILLLTSLLVSLINVDSQAQYRSEKGKKNKYRFNAGLMLGINFSQIDGDNFSGFNKRGLQASLKGMIYLNKKWDVTTGITFVQRGSRFEDHRTGILDKNSRKIHLDYVEVPLLLTYKKLQQNGRGVRLDIGGSFARLFNSKVEEVITPFSEVFSYGTLEEQYTNNEFNVLAGASYFFNRRIAIGFQFTYQLNKLYDNPAFSYDPLTWCRPFKDVEHLRNYQFGVQLIYHLL